mgnify:CR=1 FL=1
MTKGDFLKQNIIQVNSDSFKIESFFAYFSSCPDEPHNGDPVTVAPIKGNSLKDTSFTKLFNERHLPVCITFDHVLFLNPRNEISPKHGFLTIKVY